MTPGSPAAVPGKAGSECFTALIREQLAASPVLRYSARRRLVRQASRHGMAPFHANLLIAAVEYEHRSISETPSTPPRRLHLVGAVAALLAAELLVLWWALSL